MDSSAIASSSSSSSSLGLSNSSSGGGGCKETIALHQVVLAGSGGGGGGGGGGGSGSGSGSGGDGNGSFASAAAAAAAAPPPPPPPPLSVPPLSSASRFMPSAASSASSLAAAPPPPEALRTSDGGGPSSSSSSSSHFQQHAAANLTTAAAAGTAGPGTIASAMVVRGQVMTDEQMETLRRQISVYATICQQLVEMHKATMAQQNAIPGPRYGQWNTLDPTFHSMGQKFTSRQRWTPSQTQLQILEKLFQQGNGTPSKQRIKEISVDLSQYGQISETNVYNWFQNRRARTKRKQQAGGVNNAESELDTDVDSQEDKKPRMDRDLSHDSLGPNKYAANSQNWGNAEHQPPSNAARKGLDSAHKLAAAEEFADPDGLPSRVPWESAGTLHEGKPDHIGTSTSQECQIAMIDPKSAQKYKTFNVSE